MSQDQRPPRVRLTSTAGTGAAARRGTDAAPAPAPEASSAAPPVVRRGVDWSVVILFAIACIAGGILTALFDLPGLLLS